MHALTELARFAVGFPASDLPQATRKRVTLLVLDLIGASAAGVTSGLAVAAAESAAAGYGQGDASIWLRAQQTSVIGAAMANSAAASALDIDDGHRGAAGHAGAGVIPTALTMAEVVGASGLETVAAIAIGYEIALRVASSRPTHAVETYASGRWVGYGAAAVACRLLGLDPEETAHALAIAGSESPVVLSGEAAKFGGTSIKEGIPPAVVAGITAAYRARSGATGPIEMLDNSEQFRRELLTGSLGTTWEAAKCYLKPYACCRMMHAAIDAILSMRRGAGDIRALQIFTFTEATLLANERAPTTLEGAQYSFYFSCAVAALYGAEAVRIFKPDLLKDKEVLALASRVELVPSPEFAGAFPKQTPARVVFDDGLGAREKTILHPLGDVANPMSEQEVVEKFLKISRATLPQRRQQKLKNAIDLLEIEGVRPMMDLLAPPCGYEAA